MEDHLATSNNRMSPVAALRAFHPGWFGAVLFVLLAAFWLVVTPRTLLGTRTGEVWRR